MDGVMIIVKFVGDYYMNQMIQKTVRVTQLMREVGCVQSVMKNLLSEKHNKGG